MAQFELNAENTRQILAKAKFISKEGITSNVLITGISKDVFDRKDAEGNILEGGEQYHIVNLRAMTPDLKEMAEALIEDGAYTQATNQMLSFQVNVSEAHKWQKGQLVDIAVGSIYSNNLMENVLRVTSMSKSVANDAEVNPFAVKTDRVVASSDDKAKAKAERLAKLLAKSSKVTEKAVE